jgi:predicted type IV restriction endonuclease
MLFKMLAIERAWELRVEEVPKVRQIFVTKSRILAEKVEEHFTKLIISLSTGNKSPEELKELAQVQKLEQEKEALIAAEDKPEYRSDLPNRFSLLAENHFPLFITFDHVSRFLCESRSISCP